MNIKKIIATILIWMCVTQSMSFAIITNKNISENELNGGSMENIITVPDLNKDSKTLIKETNSIIRKADKMLDSIADLKKKDINFDNVLGVLDDVSYYVGNFASILNFLMNTSQDKDIRQTCEKMLVKLESWSIGVTYREDVYKIVMAFSKLNVKLKGEEKKLLSDTLKHYKRLGLHLNKEKRQTIEELKQQLSILSIEFSKNIREDKTVVMFKKSELKGLTKEILKELEQDELKNYVINPKIASLVDKVMKNADIEATRKKLYIARLSVAKDKNVEVLNKIIKLRYKLARILGFKSWADYKIDVNMARKKNVVSKFLIDFKDKLEDKFLREIKSFEHIKGGALMPWDVSYYKTKLIKEKYNVDINELRNYFSFDLVLTGMFKIMGEVFRFEIKKVKAPYKWAKEVELYSLRDSKTKDILGLFYLDMFPRPGKFTHAAQFGLASGKISAQGKNLRPTVALVCNFDKPTKDKPSLLTYRQVETLFHEFGHVLHNILSQTKFTSNFGTNVPVDFVEVPSQVLESWVENKTILDVFAYHYKDKSKKIPKDIIMKLKAIKNIDIATFYRAQIAYGLIDMELHSKTKFKDDFDIVKYSNKIFKDIYFEMPKDTYFVAGFGHLAGYDAGYYGYAWADVISKDIASEFLKSKKKFLDKSLGYKLRKEIFEKGESREVSESIKKFLGRKYSIDSFIKILGISE